MVLVGASVLPRGFPRWSLNKHELKAVTVVWVNSLQGPLRLEKQLLKWEGDLSTAILGSGPDSAPDLLWDLSKVIFPPGASVFCE